QILPNTNGSAAGCQLHHQNKHYFMLPGPPRECLPMFRDYVLPELTQKQRDRHVLLKWPLFGVAESEIAELLETALADLNIRTGYRLDPPYVEFKVRCLPEDVAAVEARVMPVITPALLGNGQDKASETLLSCLQQRHNPLLIEDEVTAGLLQQMLTRH